MAPKWNWCKWVTLDGLIIAYQFDKITFFIGRFGERQVFSLWRIMCGFNMLNVADYVRFGCGGLCAVVISTYRSSFPELKIIVIKKHAQRSSWSDHTK